MSTLQKLMKFVEQTKSQTAFAQEVRCSKQYISLVLKGERGVSWPLAKRISRVTGIPAPELMELGRAPDRVT